MKIFLISASCLVIISCGKLGSGPCDQPSNAMVEVVDTPVVEGWDLKLMANSSNGNKFSWKGPNGWSNGAGSNASDANFQTIPNVTAQNSGIYTLKVFGSGSCPVYTGQVTVNVIPPPPPPCTI